MGTGKPMKTIENEKTKPAKGFAQVIFSFSLVIYILVIYNQYVMVIYIGYICKMMFIV